MLQHSFSRLFTDSLVPRLTQPTAQHSLATLANIPGTVMSYSGITNIRIIATCICTVCVEGLQMIVAGWYPWRTLHSLCYLILICDL